MSMLLFIGQFYVHRGYVVLFFTLKLLFMCINLFCLARKTSWRTLCCCKNCGESPVESYICLVSTSYESLNGNLRLVLLTWCFKQLSDPNATVVYRGNAILLTVRMYFVVFINWVSKPTRSLDIKGNFNNSEMPWPQNKINRSYLLTLQI